MKSCLSRLVAVGSLTLLSIAIFAAYAQPPTKSAPRAVLRAASELKWVDVPDVKGAQQAVAWGNAQKGAHGSFAKFPGGTEIALHTHTAAGRTVVISGTVVEGLEGQKPKELGAGSYFFMPGGVKHSTACKAGAECIIYTDWMGAFDLKPATP